MELRNKTIIVISPEPWGVNHLSKHHYSLELASAGNLVFFLEPPTNENKIVTLGHNLKVVKYRRKVRGLNLLPDFLRVPLMKLEWKSIRKLINSAIDIIWSFDPFRFQDLHLLPGNFKLFHSVDLINSSWAIYTAGNADLVLASNRKIMERYQDLNCKIHLLGHGLSSNFINRVSDSAGSNRIEKSDRPAIGYSGNLLIEYLDREIMLDLVKLNPGYNFYFFGPYKISNLTQKLGQHSTAFVRNLKKQKNCFLFGAVPPAELYYYLHQMDVLLICYNTKLYLNEVADSHKVLEYLSTGKTVVSSYMLAYEEHSHLVEMTTENARLCQTLQKVVGNLKEYNSESRVNMRKQFALARSYKNRIAEIEGVMDRSKPSEDC